MKIAKMLSSLGFVIGIAVWVIAGEAIGAVFSFGFACFHLGIQCGERSRE